MANKNRTIRNTPTRKTYRRDRTIDDLKSRLEVAEMMVDLLSWVKPTPAQLLSRSQRLRLGDVSAATGVDRQQLIRHGVDMFLEIEAPVWMKSPQSARAYFGKSVN